MKKDEMFVWSPMCQEAFDGLRSTLKNAVMRHHFDPSLPTTITTDAADGVTGAFRPDGLVLTPLCKIIQAQVFQEKKLKDKRIHDHLILLRVTFSIIVLESLRTIARWVVFAVISFFSKLANTTPSHQLF